MSLTEIHGDIIYSGEIDARMNELDALYAHTEDSSEWEEDHADEYAELRNFKDEIVSTWSEKAWNEGLSFVADSYWDEYAASHAHEIYGEATETLYWNDDLYSADLQDDFTKITLDDVEYWGDGQR